MRRAQRSRTIALVSAALLIALPTTPVTGGETSAGHTAAPATAAPPLEPLVVPDELDRDFEDSEEMQAAREALVNDEVEPRVRSEAVVDAMIAAQKSRPASDGLSAAGDSVSFDDP